MPKGYNGRILRVDLTKGKINVEEPPETWYRSYLGGMGAVAYHLLREVPAKSDPLSPENLLILAPGVISGAPFSGSGRNAVGGKSPLTGGFGEADVGGYWAAELKHAGFVMIFFTGAAEAPVWLWVEVGEAELIGPYVNCEALGDGVALIILGEVYIGSCVYCRGDALEGEVVG